MNKKNYDLTQQQPELSLPETHHFPGPIGRS